MDIVTFDFETESIEARPEYPPRPVGVSIKWGASASRYWSWGHPSENNCTYEEARAELARVWGSGIPLLCHNAKFDMDVAETHMGLPFPTWSRIHDTQFLVYLFDPHAKRFGLKPSSERILDLPPDEQDLLKDWILRHVPGTSASRKSEKYWAGYICKGPGTLVGEYAKGDTDRAFALYQKLYQYMIDSQMVGAYDRERRLMPVMLAAERTGIRTDWERLDLDVVKYRAAKMEVERRIHGLLKSPNMNLDSGAELAEALERSGLAGPLPLTPTGKRSTAKDALQSAVRHPGLLAMLRYRGALKTCLGTFMEPWLAQANANAGRIHTQWHQTRGDAEKGGTVTGRLSSTGPNFMNIPNDFTGLDVEALPPLPHMRSYLLPEEGHVWLKRDYSSQEVRVLAHFEDGGLMSAYTENPKLDPHQYGADVIRQQTGYTLDRKKVKIIVFSILYGSGVKHLSEQLQVPYHEAAQVKDIYLGAFPDVGALMSEIKSLGDRGLPVRTLGGRVLYPEPPVDGRRFSYKLLNHLIQGSSADATKEAILRYVDANESGVFLATVHDEINICAPVDLAVREMQLLKEAMSSVPCDVPLLSEGYMGRSWHEADNNKVDKL